MGLYSIVSTLTRIYLYLQEDMKKGLSLVPPSSFREKQLLVLIHQDYIYSIVNDLCVHIYNIYGVYNLLCGYKQRKITTVFISVRLQTYLTYQSPLEIFSSLLTILCVIPTVGTEAQYNNIFVIFILTLSEDCVTVPV